MPHRPQLRAITIRPLVVLAVLTSLFAGHGAVRADEADDAFATARGLFQDKRWSLAEFAFRQFLVKYPDNENVPTVSYYHGMSQLQLQKHADARTTLRSFAKKYADHPEIPHATYRIAECSYQMGDLDAAVDEFNTALKAYPDESFRDFAWAYLGDAQRQRKKYRDAVTNLTKALDGRMASEARFGLAQTQEALGEKNEAIRLYREVAADEKASRADAAQLGVANLLFADGKFAAAVVEYESVESKFATSDLVPVARLNAGFANYQLGEFRAAMVLFDQAEADPKQQVTAGYWKGLSMKALGDHNSAADVLEDVAKLAGDDPLAESIVYQLADCVYRSGQLDRAETRFLEVADRWPRSRYADHSLYFATECLIRKAQQVAGEPRREQLKEVGLLLDRFDQDYSTSSIRQSHNLQRGQYLRLLGEQDDLVRAEQIYLSVLGSSRQQATVDEARYQLALVRQKLGNTQGAAEAIKPLAEAVIEDAQRDFPQSLILYSQLARDTGDFPAATRAARKYLDTQPRGEFRAEALSSLAMSGAFGGDWLGADTALNQLLAAHSDSPLVAQTMLNVARKAEDEKLWAMAIRLNQALVDPGKESPYHASGLYGLALCRYRNEEFTKAEPRFREFIAEYPEHDLAPDASFHLGHCLSDAGDKTAAAVAFTDCFQKYRPKRQALFAGIEAARTYFRLKNFKAGDEAYADVSAAFVEAKESAHDTLLNEWAGLLYDAEDYERSDAVYRELIQKYPESSHADNARYSLAESDLINGQVEDARAEFIKLAADEKSDESVQEESLYRLVGIGVETEKWQDVIKYAAELESRFADSAYAAEVSFYQGDAFIRLQEYKKAEPVLAGLLSLVADPQVSKSEWFQHTWVLLAEAQLQQKKYRDVEKTAELMRDWNPDSDVLHRIDEVLGRAFKNQARFDEARTALKRVTNSKRGNRTETAAKAQLLIAETWFLQEQYEQASVEYYSVVSLYQYPVWQSAALFQAAKCSELLDMKADAIETYRELIKDYPESDYAKDASKRLKQLNAG